MDRSWLNRIDLDRITLYPIQFANCDRLAKNDAVYIFDEVGCGKTISTIHYKEKETGISPKKGDSGLYFGRWLVTCYVHF